MTAASPRFSTQFEGSWRSSLKPVVCCSASLNNRTLTRIYRIGHTAEYKSKLRGVADAVQYTQSLSKLSDRAQYGSSHSLRASTVTYCQGKKQPESATTKQQQQRGKNPNVGASVFKLHGSSATTERTQSSKQFTGVCPSQRHHRGGATEHSSAAQRCSEDYSLLPGCDRQTGGVGACSHSTVSYPSWTDHLQDRLKQLLGFCERWWRQQAAAITSSILAALQRTLLSISPADWLPSVQQMFQPAETLQRSAGYLTTRQPCWPPSVPEGHVCASVATLLQTRGTADRKLLKTCGFDATGRALDPLVDLPAWRISQLTGHPVGQLDLYRKALTHVTALPTSKEIRILQSYERLEWLGDSVLELVVRSLLMNKFPAAKEGDLSQVCQAVVSGAMAHTFAMFLGLDRWVVMGAHDMRSGAHREPKVMADVFESLLGALYQDQGFLAVQTFLERVLNSCIDWDEVLGEKQDARAPLARLAQEKRLSSPVYIVTATEKRMVERIGVLRQYVTLEVRVGERVLGRATHWLRSSAQKRAARQALAVLERTSS